MTALAHLSPATFGVLVSHLRPYEVQRWLHAHREAVLPETLWDQLVDQVRSGELAADVEDAMVEMQTIPQGALEQLCRTRRSVAARALAKRHDLTDELLRTLLTRDDTQTCAAVWDNPACTDELRRVILTGRTMNPRSRSNKLVQLPRFTDRARPLPPRLIPEALESHDPHVVLAVPVESLSGYQRALRDRNLLRAVNFQLTEKSPYNVRVLSRVVTGRLATPQLAALFDDPELVTVDQPTGTERTRRVVLRTRRGSGRPGSRVAPWTYQVASFKAGIARMVQLADEHLAGLDEPSELGRDERQAQRDALRTGEGVLDFDRLEDLCGLSADEIDPGVLRSLIASRDDLLELDDLVAAGDRGVGLPISALHRLREAGLTTSCPVRSDATPVDLLVHTITPARRVLDMHGPAAGAVGALISEVIGDDPTLAETYATLADDFAGTVAALLETTQVLATGEVTQIEVGEKAA